MKISKIEVIPLTLPRYRPFKTSRGVWGNEFAYVRITSDDGIVGIGDAGHPKPTHYGETIEGMINLIHKYIGPQLLGSN
jgi:L-alanine-DL-glutamate epimerase-like enolase superfamily enzyme